MAYDDLNLLKGISLFSMQTQIYKLYTKYGDLLGDLSRPTHGGRRTTGSPTERPLS